MLLSIPIYQTSILLAPTSIIGKMDGLVRKFLWEGGKGNLNRLHLVSWDKIQKPFKEGGLQIRNLAKQNLAMGAKILWNLVSGRESWSKKFLRKKHFHRQRLRCIDHTPQLKKGSPIYKLCLKVIDHFRANLYWIPGNGKKINLWEDSIMGEQPLGQIFEIENIKSWLQDRNIETLWDISSWDDDDARRSWKGWNIGDYPQRLKEEADLLTQLLHGKAPLASSVHDKRGWGHHSGSYTAAKGYRSFQALQYAAPNPAQWNFIWSYPFVPKIDFFCWTLAHRSILTGENLKNRGMEGP